MNEMNDGKVSHSKQLKITLGDHQEDETCHIALMSHEEKIMKDHLKAE